MLPARGTDSLLPLGALMSKSVTVAWELMFTRGSNLATSTRLPRTIITWDAASMSRGQLAAGTNRAVRVGRAPGSVRQRR